jgi:hypothetical protein
LPVLSPAEDSFAMAREHTPVDTACIDNYPAPESQLV